MVVADTLVILPPETVMETVTDPYWWVTVGPAKVPFLNPLRRGSGRRLRRRTSLGRGHAGRCTRGRTRRLARGRRRRRRIRTGCLRIVNRHRHSGRVSRRQRRGVGRDGGDAGRGGLAAQRCRGPCRRQNSCGRDDGSRLASRAHQENLSLWIALAGVPAARASSITRSATACGPHTYTSLWATWGTNWSRRIDPYCSGSQVGS